MESLKHVFINDCKKIRASRKSLLAILVLIIIFISESIEVALAYSDFKWEESIFFNSVTEGHIQILLFTYLFSTVFIVFYSSKIHTELRPELVFIYIKNKKQYIMQKIVISFIFGMIIVLSLIFVDVIMNYVRYFYVSSKPGFIPWAYLGDASVYKDSWPFLSYRIANPLQTIALYSVLTAIFFGLLSSLTTALTFVFPDIKSVYLLSFGVAVFLSINTFAPSGKIIQPFTEGTVYTLAGSAIFAYTIFIVAIIACIIIAYKKDDYV